MASERRFKADGDAWSVRLGETSEREGFRTLLFFCVTTNQRPYRVVEVPEERLADQAAVDKLDDASVEELFRASRSMGYPLDFE
ncbi:MAG: hypothetical protein V3W24_08000 [Gemmatimonadota bacterium]|jgi:hypothetical protein